MYFTFRCVPTVFGNVTSLFQRGFSNIIDGISVVKYTETQSGLN